MGNVRLSFLIPNMKSKSSRLMIDIRTSIISRELRIGSTMVIFIAGLYVGSFSMPTVMSLIVAAKRGPKIK